MYPLSADDAFFQSLRTIDFELFQATKSKPCSLCGGRMDTSHFPRKPRGAGELESKRFSLCCRKEGCRHRVTPPSLRFLGRKIYSAWVVILAIEYCRDLGLGGQISRQTIARWKSFWRAQLAESHSFMRWARGLLPPGTPISSLPSACLRALGLPAQESWVAILRFFSHAG